MSNTIRRIYFCFLIMTFMLLLHVVSDMFRNVIVVFLFNVHVSVHRNDILIYISNKMQRYTVYFIWNLLYMFRVVPSPIMRSANNCIYSIWYLSHRYCYLPLSWKSWNWFDLDDGWRYHPKHVDQIPNKINCKVASCWIHIRIECDSTNYTLNKATTVTAVPKVYRFNTIQLEPTPY